MLIEFILFICSIVDLGLRFGFRISGLMVWGEGLGVIVVVGLIGKVIARVGKLGYWLIGVDL